LVDKSLVEVEAPSEATEGRFRLLETIRQYAREQLLAAGEAEPVRDRHLDYFLRLAEEAEPKLRGPEQSAWLERLERDHDNLRAALAWALQSGVSASALRLAGALYYFWESLGHFSQGQKWLDEALAAREQSERIVAGGITSTRTETAWRAKALFAAGRLCYATLFNPVDSRTMVEESLHLWRELRDTWWTAVALEHIGFMLTVEADLPRSRACLEEGVALARELTDRWPLARCLVRLASPVLQIDVAASHRMCEEGVATARSVGDRNILCHGLSELAISYFLTGDLAAAAAAAEESWMEARAIGSVTYIFLSLFRLTLFTCLQGDLVRGKEYCAEMLIVAREKGLDFGYTLVLIPFAYIAIFSGKPQRGARLLGAAEGSFGQRGFKLASSDAFRRVHKQALEVARVQLDPVTLETALQEGRALTLEQAIALATEDEALMPRLPRGLRVEPAAD
jgi:non-specific serine/threonine protein kinase